MHLSVLYFRLHDFGKLFPAADFNGLELLIDHADCRGYILAAVRHRHTVGGISILDIQHVTCDGTDRFGRIQLTVRQTQIRSGQCLGRDLAGIHRRIARQLLHSIDGKILCGCS